MILSLAGVTLQDCWYQHFQDVRCMAAVESLASTAMVDRSAERAEGPQEKISWLHAQSVPKYCNQLGGGMCWEW